MQESLTSGLLLESPRFFHLLYRYMLGTYYVSDAVLGPRGMMEEN